MGQLARNTEAEIVVATDDVPMGVTADDALGHIQLILLVNDVSLRNLIPGELAKGFGFFQSKPSSAFSPVAVTPDELGEAWRDSTVRLPLHSYLNGEWFGSPDAGTDMQFNFGQLVAHATFGAGVIARVEGEGDRLTITVDFQDVGRKHVLPKFAPLTPID